MKNKNLISENSEYQELRTLTSANFKCQKFSNFVVGLSVIIPFISGNLYRLNLGFFNFSYLHTALAEETLLKFRLKLYLGLIRVVKRYHSKVSWYLTLVVYWYQS